jgi:hypothetical protein
LPGPRTTPRSRRRWPVIVAAIVAFPVVVVLLAAIALHPLARAKLLDYLEARYESDVDLGRLEVTLFPHFGAVGDSLVFRHRGRTDVPPLITIRRFTVDGGFGLLERPIRVRRVRLEGLELHVPPRRDRDSTAVAETPRHRRRGPLPQVLIAEIVADGTQLTILSKHPDKDPLWFDIHKLTLRSVGRDRPMTFRAELTNAKPPGEIRSEGNFGPWQGDDPGLTPVDGSYVFENADLSVFRGVAGILASEGQYRGVLSRLDVTGWTDIPDFAVSSGVPIHLRTDFAAVVDGTDGDTILDPVVAQFLRSRLIARGGVVNRPGTKGKSVVLDVSVVKARVEDMLKFGMKAEKPPLVGQITFRAAFDLPPGDADVIDKLKLDGRFGIAGAEFTDKVAQEKLAKLSHTGRVDDNDDDPDSVAASPERVLSNLSGRFVFDRAVAHFSNLTFAVPGAKVKLDGSYALHSEELDFGGHLEMDAAISQTTTGIKSFLLKPVDLFLRKKGGGASIPIQVTGTVAEPDIGLDLFGHKKHPLPKHAPVVVPTSDSSATAPHAGE